MITNKKGKLVLFPFERLMTGQLRCYDAARISSKSPYANLMDGLQLLIAPDPSDPERWLILDVKNGLLQIDTVNGWWLLERCKLLS